MSILKRIFGQSGIPDEVREALDALASKELQPDIFAEKHLRCLERAHLDESAIPFLEKACFSRSLLVRRNAPLLLHRVYQRTRAFRVLKALASAVSSPDADSRALQVLVQIGDLRSVKLLQARDSSDQVDETIKLIVARSQGVETLAEQRLDSAEGIERMLGYLVDHPDDWGMGQALLFLEVSVAYVPVLFRLLSADPDRFLPLAQYLVDTHAVNAVFWRKANVIEIVVDCYTSKNSAVSRLADEVLTRLSENYERPSKPYTREKWKRWAEDPLRYEE
jgi:hypothetical protein